MGGNRPEVEKVLETRINTGYYHLCLVVTTTCTKWRKSSPTLSAILFKINELPRFHNPLSEPLFVFGMRDMQFSKVQVRSVKAKTE